MRLPIHSISGAPTAVFDPGTLSLSGWWRASYTGSPFVGRASAGGSGSQNLTEATNPPAVGAALNGLTPADFDGINDVLGGATLATFQGAAAWSLSLLLKIDTIIATAAGEGQILSDTTGTFGVGTNTASNVILVEQYDVSWKRHTAAISAGAYTLVQAKYDGTNLHLRTNSSAFTQLACGSNATLAGNLRVGASRAAFAKFFDGQIPELMLSQSAFSTAKFDDIKAYTNSRYGLSL